MKKVLSIAGSDSGGGAGIQADLKAFSALGVFGMTAITALTAQNTIGVQGVFDIDPEFVAKQIDSVMEDIGADAWKTGMLSNARIVNIVADRARKYEIDLLIVDPVMVAKSGDYLLKEEAIQSVIQNLIPLSFIVTPNVHEAQVLAEIKIDSLDKAKEAASRIHQMGAQNVLIKGGHMDFDENAADLLYNGTNFTQFIAPRIDTKNTHGTGCTYASALAAELAKGKGIIPAVHVAKAYLTAAIKQADEMNIGSGHGPTNHFQNTQVSIDLSLVRVKKQV